MSLFHVSEVRVQTAPAGLCLSVVEAKGVTYFTSSTEVSPLSEKHLKGTLDVHYPATYTQRKHEIHTPTAHLLDLLILNVSPNVN